MDLEFCTIASGSSGNCSYIGTEYTKILMDAGISGKKIQEGLAELGLSGDQIDGLFITHEHVDHIKGAGVFSRRFDVPIYATPDTWAAMEGSIGKIAPWNKKFVYEDEVCAVNDLCITPFAIPHDAAEPVGFSVCSGKKKITLATDIGHVTDNLREHIENSNILLLEANHDEKMLRMGSYPWKLKQRILSDRGHLSNHTAGQLLSEVMTGEMQHVCLGHLSDENNDPHLAYETVEGILRNNHIEVGTDVKMDMAYRFRNGAKVRI